MAGKSNKKTKMQAGMNEPKNMPYSSNKKGSSGKKNGNKKSGNSKGGRKY